MKNETAGHQLEKGLGAWEESSIKDELAHAKVPAQSLGDGSFFSPDDSLRYGTVFTSLHKPYNKNQASRR
ncbi:MAG: spore coat associated protein CotJA [Clostridiales bacterium]|jgi:hypothetical protein|nr:spore coat associated protein CotJA [Clostridiales bacterium]